MEAGRRQDLQDGLKEPYGMVLETLGKTSTSVP
jgi:hypothetical protein